MPKNDLKSRSALEQKPVLKVQHKRRTEADMRKALADFVVASRFCAMMNSGPASHRCDNWHEEYPQ